MTTAARAVVDLHAALPPTAMAGVIWRSAHLSADLLFLWRRHRHLWRERSPIAQLNATAEDGSDLGPTLWPGLFEVLDNAHEASLGHAAAKALPISPATQRPVV